jgi:hypothetical protein
MVAQIYKQQTAMVAFAVNPAGNADGLADIGGAKNSAGMGAVGMHYGGSGARGLGDLAAKTLETWKILPQAP